MANERLIGQDVGVLNNKQGEELIKNTRIESEGLQEVKLRGFEVVKDEFIVGDKDVKLPIRGTQASAGYDIHLTEDIEIKPQEKVSFLTNIKAYMPQDEVLLINVRSSIGYKKDLMIANTTGIIDSDFYCNKDNDGNIGICLRNLKPNLKFEDGKVVDLTKENTIRLSKGERVAQGIFVKYGVADNGNTDKIRQGGIGSTNE